MLSGLSYVLCSNSCPVETLSAISMLDNLFRYHGAAINSCWQGMCYSPEASIPWPLSATTRLEKVPKSVGHRFLIVSRSAIAAIIEYRVERDTCELSAAARLSGRREVSRPLVDDLKKWLEEDVFLPKSLSGKAATYTLNQWNALNRYLEDGDLSIDDNASERAMRLVAIIRSNWMFVGSKPAGHRALILMSMIATCKANLVEPCAWLVDVPIQLPFGPSPESLLPN